MISVLVGLSIKSIKEEKFLISYLVDFYNVITSSLLGDNNDDDDDDTVTYDIFDELLNGVSQSGPEQHQDRECNISSYSQPASSS